MRHRWLPLSGAVAWALTRDKQFTVRASRAPAKCFVGDDLIYAGDKNKLRKPALEHYFDNAETAWEHVCKEITNGKIKTNPPDWSVRVDENWLTNGPVKIDYAELQFVFPQNGPKLLTSKLIGSPVRPSDVSDMSLTEIAYWIATEGGAAECVISNVEEGLKPTFAELLKRIVNDEVDLLGRRHGAGLHEKIPGEALADIRIHYPFQVWSEYILSDKSYLECSGIGSSDNLFSGGQLQYSNLRVKGAEVARLWSFRERSKSVPKECYDGEGLHLQQTSLTPVSEKGARGFVKKYIADAKAEGQPPTQAGLERAARAADLRGRDRLRAAFHEKLGPDAPKRGRPCRLK